jgi:hydroxymethylpyrimidine pyrophosphatase-like HAD family hydrolase
MRPLEALEAKEANGLTGLVFDLDDTVLDSGRLSEAAYGALFRLRESGLVLVACTGRPAGWGELVQRMWPVDATVTENGALAWIHEGERVVPLSRTPVADLRARRAELLALAEELVARHPAATLADDNGARLCDVTLDIGEHRSVEADEVREMMRFAEARGVRTFRSSVHMHLTSSTEDKASGTLWMLGAVRGEDSTAGRHRYAFVGDSENDAVAFGAFHTTFGVANVRPRLGRIAVPPRYVADAPRGAGFAAIAARLVELRQAPARDL